MYLMEDAADDSSIPLEVCDGNNDDDDDGDVVMSDPSKIRSEYERRRTSKIATHVTSKRRAIRGRLLHTGNIGSFFYWMDPHLIAAEVVFLNKLYRTCAEIGKLDHFRGLLQCKSKTAYITKKNNLQRDVWSKQSKVGVVALNMCLPFRYFWKYKDAAGACQIVPDDMTYQEPSRCSHECAESQSTRPPITKHDVHILEETMKFEHGNQ